jgi:transcriptional regulator with XRE-family HTH domain
MQYTIRQMRDRYGWTQQKLADRTLISRARLSDVERGRFGPHPDELQRLADAFKCEACDLAVKDTRPCGGQTQPLSALLALHHASPRELDVPQYNGEFRLAARRRSYPDLMDRLEPLIPFKPEWKDFLRSAPSGSGDETAFHLLELERGCRVCRATLADIDFDQWPALEYIGQPGLWNRRLPALVTRDWLLIPQVPLLTPTPFTLDGLLLVQQPRRTFLNLEIDGEGHNAKRDEFRTKRLKLPTLRLKPDDLHANLGLTQHLHQMHYCTPRPGGRPVSLRPS